MRSSSFAIGTLVVLWLGLSVTGEIALADPAADANAALQAFITDAFSNRSTPSVQSFVAPEIDSQHAVAALDRLPKLVASPTSRILATHVAKSGSAAWITAEIPGARYRDDHDNIVARPLRVSAFLVLAEGSWHVQAAHISGGQPDRPRARSCGLIALAYEPPARIAPGAEPAVKSIADAFVGRIAGESTTAHAIATLSDDRAAQMFGSAPDEAFTGGTTIKRIFRNWTIDLYAMTDHARAGISPGGDLAWVATEAKSWSQCTSYRVLFVLQKEGDAWKIVHQHYSVAVDPP